MNKWVLLCLLVAGTSAEIKSQSFRNGLGIHFAGIDFYGPQSGQYLGYSHTEADGNSKMRFGWDPAIQASYWYKINRSFDFVPTLNVSALQYPDSKNDLIYQQAKQGKTFFQGALPFVSLDLNVHYNILERGKHFLSPYVISGLSASLRSSKAGVDLPLGAGLQLAIQKNIQFVWQSDYRLAITSSNQNHLVHSIGIVYWWNNKQKSAPAATTKNEPVVAKDTDNDGIPDSEDACPTLPGRKELKGCPDTDGDGIADPYDKCPTVAGLAKYGGCPIPDTDHDGFNDEVDKCPDVASSTNNGCPEIKQEDKKNIDIAAKGIYFESNSAQIRTVSLENLDKIVAKVTIEGHTDNTGSSESNMLLSQHRADACKDYLVLKGISADRIQSNGYGDTQPVAGNNSEEGKAKNRRTEFKIHSY